MRIDWKRAEHGAGWRADVGNNVTLFAAPCALNRRGDKAARGSTWRAGASHWDENTRTMSRFGRDSYMELCADSKEAMRLAECIWNEAR